MRDAILRIVREEPGIGMGELRERLGVAWGTLRRHVRSLEEEGSLDVVEAGRRRIAVPTGGGVDAREAHARHALRLPALRALAESVAASPPRDARELAQRLGQPERTTYARVSRLARAGLVEARGRGGGVRPTGLLLRLLARDHE